MFSVIEQNKLAFVILVMVVLALLTFIVFSAVAQAGGIELAGASMMRYCVGSGGVCTGGI
ncbi:hypothetical protein [Candidatus Leptofilum sp.]|uniref:hypothetical protein n=1 Tax=Candidatus Leptofilum sp. TaxID=3241576 RepID=UPI003B5C91E2